VGLFRVLQSDALQRPRRGIDRRVPQLLGVHLAEALVSGDRRLASALSVVRAFIGRGARIVLRVLRLDDRRRATPRLRARRLLLALGRLRLAILALLLRLGPQLLDDLVALAIA